LSKVEIVLLILASVSLVALLYLVYKLKSFSHGDGGNNAGASTLLDYQEKLSRNMTDSVLSAIKHYNESVLEQLSIISSSTKENIKDIVERQDKLLKENIAVFEKTSDILAHGLEKMQKDNSEKLEKMRETVDEKLNSSLQKRFNESFKLITDRLQEVYTGLGEMKSLAVGVGDLKKVLTNVKTRGVWGEVQLGNLLSQILAPNQFDANVQVKENSQERVDYVIRIPAKDGNEVLLPIDAKFPIEDYQRLVDAYEKGDKAEIDVQTKNLIRRVKEEAKKIKEKYILPPNTTDFAFMYFPIEGLYAEITKQPGLMEQLQRDYKVSVNGPNTLSAMLNSLQLGFRTITIEKRSTEIWALLGTFKYEFSNFVDLLAKTQKKLDEASRTIDDATRKSRTIQTKLRHVSTDTEAIEQQTEVLEIDKDVENPED
jgi:DNA recombination protein RmuC